MKNIESLRAFFLILFLLFGLNSCSPEAKQNVILITLDTQRADHISAYDSHSASTPNIDSLAEDGVLFEKCYSPIPITLPAHASIFYSQLPSQLQVYNNGHVFNGEGKESLAEIFQERGYATGAFVSLGVLKKRFGLTRGFDTYDDDFPLNKWYLSAAEINQKAYNWLETNKLNDFFLWIHYSDPHGPYSPPEEPPDLNIHLNDVFQKNICLDKNEIEEMDIALKKGKNVLRLEVKNAFNNDPKRHKARLDLFEVIPASEEEVIRIECGAGAIKRNHRGRSNIFLGEMAHLNIFSNKALHSIKIKLRGRLLMKPNGSQAMYKKEVEFMDNEVGKLLARLKSLDLYDNTAIIVVGDHGEGLGEYILREEAPHIGHIHFLYSLYLEVPYIIHSPHLRSTGKRIISPVSILDVGPTILGMLGWKQPDQMKGKNVLELEKHGQEPLDILGETYEPQSFFTSFCLIRYPWHLIITPKENRFELYDLGQDPWERKNLYPSIKSEREISDMKIKINDYMRKSLAQKLPEKEKDKDTLEMLRSLGYIR
ncbi:sulfatase [Acidobacteriota bacterium]